MKKLNEYVFNCIPVSFHCFSSVSPRCAKAKADSIFKWGGGVGESLTLGTLPARNRREFARLNVVSCSSLGGLQGSGGGKGGGGCGGSAINLATLWGMAKRSDFALSAGRLLVVSKRPGRETTESRLIDDLDTTQRRSEVAAVVSRSSNHGL